MALWSNVLAFVSGLLSFLHLWLRMALGVERRLKAIIKWAGILLCVAVSLGLFEIIGHSGMVQVAVRYGPHAFQHGWELSKIVGVAAFVFWVFVTCGVAWARTDWRSITIGEPEWDPSKSLYRLEVRKKGELGKAEVWVEIEEMRFQDGTVESNFWHLPLKLQPTRHTNDPRCKEFKLLIGREGVDFLQVIEMAGAAPGTPPIALRLVGAGQWPQVSLDTAPEHALRYFFVGVHDDKRRVVSKWMCFDLDSSVDYGHRVYTVNRVPWKSRTKRSAVPSASKRDP